MIESTGHRCVTSALLVCAASTAEVTVLMCLEVMEPQNTEDAGGNVQKEGAEAGREARDRRKTKESLEVR